MGRGLRWNSLAHLGATLPKDRPTQAPKLRAVKLGRGDSVDRVNKGEVLFAFQAGVCQLPPHKRNYVFHPTRKWEIDFAWPQFKVGIEIQGGIWGKSRDDDSPGAHGHPIGIRRDMSKHNALLDLGWRVYLFEPKEVKDGSAVKHMESVLASLVTTLLTNE